MIVSSLESSQLERICTDAGYVLLKNIYAGKMEMYLELSDTERPVTTLPMNNMYGWSIINSHFVVGVSILLTDHGLMQKEFWRFMKGQSATPFGAGINLLR